MDELPLPKNLSLTIDKLSLPTDITNIIKQYVINPIAKEIHDKQKNRHYIYNNKRLICEKIIDDNTIKNTNLYENLCCNEFKICETKRDGNTVYSLINVYWGKEKLLCLYRNSLFFSSIYNSTSIYGRMQNLNNLLIFNIISYSMYNKMCHDLTLEQLENIYRWYILHYL